MTAINRGPWSALVDEVPGVTPGTTINKSLFASVFLDPIDAALATSEALVRPVAAGGTGLASYAVGDLLYASGATTLAKLADVAVGQVLVSGGVATAPAWSASPSLTGLTLSAHLTLDPLSEIRWGTAAKLVTDHVAFPGLLAWGPGSSAPAGGIGFDLWETGSGIAVGQNVTEIAVFGKGDTNAVTMEVLSIHAKKGTSFHIDVGNGGTAGVLQPLIFSVDDVEAFRMNGDTTTTFTSDATFGVINAGTYVSTPQISSLGRGDTNIAIEINSTTRWAFTHSTLNYAFVPNAANAYDIGANILPIQSLFLAKYVEGVEMTAPGAGPANSGRLYFDDNGSGKTRLMCVFNTGAAQQVAIQP